MSKYKTIEEVQAVIIGVLFKDEGKIVTSKFNKITREFGLDRIGKDDLKEIVEDIRKDEYLNELKNKAIKGKVTLETLKMLQITKYLKVITTMKKYLLM